jgi:hypothetical protein
VQGCVLRPVCAGDGRHQPRSKETTRRPLSQVRNGMVGLAGLEPAASSLSEIEGSALCYPAFSQVVSIRKRRRDGVNRGPPATWQRSLRPGAGKVGRVHRMTETMYAPSAEFRSIHETDDSGFSRKRVAKYLNRIFLTDVGD